MRKLAVKVGSETIFGIVAATITGLLGLLGWTLKSQTTFVQDVITKGLDRIASAQESIAKAQESIASAQHDIAKTLTELISLVKTQGDAIQELMQRSDK